MKHEERYGAQIERGKVVSVSGGRYVVASLTRDGIKTPALGAARAHAVGEVVYYFMFNDGAGRIIDEGAADAVTSVNGRTGAVVLDYEDVGAAAVNHTHALSDLSGALTVDKGGTGAASAAAARSNLEITPANIGAAAASHDHDDRYLKLTGGTLSGWVKTVLSDKDYSSAPASDWTLDTYSVADQSGYEHLVNRIGQDTSNALTVSYGARRRVNGSAVFNFVTYRIAADGTRTVEVSDKAAWRTAIGLGTAATLDSAAFASASHNHDSAYSAIGHNHDSAYAAKSHNHDTVYSAIGHNHDSAYAAKTHNHDTAYSAIGHDHDGTYLKLTGGALSGDLTLTNVWLNSRRDGSNGLIAVRNTSGTLRSVMEIGTNNNFWFRQYVTTGGSVSEDYYMPAPTAETSISMDIAVKKLVGTTSSTAATSFTLPKAGRWMIITAHNSTEALNGVWIAATAGNRIVKIGGGANITFTLSGTTLSTPATTGGGASVYGIFLG